MVEPLHISYTPGLTKPLQRKTEGYINRATPLRGSIALVYLQLGLVHQRVWGILAVRGPNDK